jgi:hypothetical protein
MACAAFEGEYDKATVLHWLRVFHRRFFTQQFKRSCMPDGPAVLDVSLSPRGAWRMPSDATSALWLRQIDELEAAKSAVLTTGKSYTLSNSHAVTRADIDDIQSELAALRTELAALLRGSVYQPMRLEPTKFY